MHQTTLRFAPEVWAALEVQAARSGVSVAQYVRDATMSRLAFSAGVEHGREELELRRASPSGEAPHPTQAELSGALDGR